MSEPEPYLKRLLELLGITQSDLARQIGTTRQQISKWASEGRKIAPLWAKKMEPVLGVPWSMLVEGLIPPELQSGDSDCQHIHQQLLLIREAWPLLSFDERGAIARTIMSLADSRREAV